MWRDEGEKCLFQRPKDAASGQPLGHIHAVPCRYLFWTEWGQYPRIERSRLDGTERMVLVNVSISWPNGISVDYEVQCAQRSLKPCLCWWDTALPGPRELLSSSGRVVPKELCGGRCGGFLCATPMHCSVADSAAFSSRQDGKLYWCDARTDKIERIDLETGENREVVLSSNNMDMFSVSVFEEYIYWSDRYGAQGMRWCWGCFGRWVLWVPPQGAAAFGPMRVTQWLHPFFRTHANGSIKRGNKDNATESVSLRTGIGVQLKDIKVFNRARQKGACGSRGSASSGNGGAGNSG